MLSYVSAASNHLQVLAKFNENINILSKDTFQLQKASTQASNYITAHKIRTYLSFRKSTAIKATSSFHTFTRLGKSFYPRFPQQWFLIS